jgi:hypothetical protein
MFTLLNHSTLLRQSMPVDCIFIDGLETSTISVFKTSDHPAASNWKPLHMMVQVSKSGKSTPPKYTTYKRIPQGVKIRPLVDAINSSTYCMAKHLTKFLAPTTVNTPHHVRTPRTSFTHSSTKIASQSAFLCGIAWLWCSPQATGLTGPKVQQEQPDSSILCAHQPTLFDNCFYKQKQQSRYETHLLPFTANAALLRNMHRTQPS